MTNRLKSDEELVEKNNASVDTNSPDKAESAKKELDKLKSSTEMVRKRALDLINLLWLKNKEFINSRDEEFQRMKKDPSCSWISDMWKKIDAFKKTYNSFKESGKIIVDGQYSEKIMKDLIDYLILVWEKQDAAWQLAQVLDLKNTIEETTQTTYTSWWSFFGWKRDDLS